MITEHKIPEQTVLIKEVFTLQGGDHLRHIVPEPFDNKFDTYADAEAKIVELIAKHPTTRWQIHKFFESGAETTEQECVDPNTDIKKPLSGIVYNGATFR